MRKIAAALLLIFSFNAMAGIVPPVVDSTARAAAATADGKAVAAQGTANTALANAATADGKAVAAQNTANTALASVVPSGAVLAFNLASCPSGYTATGVPTNYTLIQGGTLGTTSVGEVIAHSHTMAAYFPAGLPAGSNYIPYSGGANSTSTDSTGGAANLAAGFRIIYCTKN